jgi:hypothetical protein
MSMRRERSRALRPRTEDLEGRRLLSATFRGTDFDGDTYILRLSGPGDLRVTLVNQAGQAVTDPTQPALINTIVVAGADPSQTRLIGRVTKGANGDGKVFFQTLRELGGRSEGVTGGLGIHAIDIPNFWLGATTTAPSAGLNGSIDIPDGVNTLRFGGVDTTFTRPGGTALNTNNTNDTFIVGLGLPRTQGASIIVDRVITSGQAAAAGQAGAQPTQDSALFLVNGRLNTFQANEIDGNSTFPSTGLIGGGGTVVLSQVDNGVDQTGVVRPGATGLNQNATGITGQIGFVRVGGNATNFGVEASDSVGNAGNGGRISNLYIGGETNNVSILTTSEARNLFFGKGLDTVTIRSHFIESLQANRGALNSSVLVDRQIGQLTFGGDVVNSQFRSGLEQRLTDITGTQTAPTAVPNAQDGGAIKTIQVAGDVRNSVFVASVESSGGQFGTAQDLVLPHGNVRAKVEGKIDNTAVTGNATTFSARPDRAFFAHSVQLSGGPITPPNVPEAPFPNPGAPPRGQRVVKGLQPTPVTTTATGTTANGTATTVAVRTAAVPRGPAKKK